jgi:glycosyltransferase involved in cell wall biosynthesis
MKITIVNTSDIRGGAAIAAFRLFKALREKLPGTRMLVRDKLLFTESVTGLNQTASQRIFIRLRFFLELLSFIIRAKNKEKWFTFSPANFGQNILNRPEIREADIIHLHWVNDGFLSLKNIRKLVDTGKPIVWTLHDMWAFTGGCHYPGSCGNFTGNCGNCPFLKSPAENDWSNKIHFEKSKIYTKNNVSFIAVSNWMAENARKSSAAGNCRIEVIPNTIDFTIYKPADKFSARDELGLPRGKFLILSGAANLKDKRKGFVFLLQALQQMKETYPELAEKFGLITFGKSGIIEDSPIPVFPQAYLRDDYSIARLYQAADVFVLPTLEDNLPSTVMESLACGTPVVAFKTGGIPDMVDHKETGYLAGLKNIEDLISGIKWVETHPELNRISENCRKKVVENFSHDVISEKYINFYRSLLK